MAHVFLFVFTMRQDKILRRRQPTLAPLGARFDGKQFGTRVKAETGVEELCACIPSGPVSARIVKSKAVG